MRVVALIEADGLAGEIAQLLDGRVAVDHSRGGDEIDRGPERRRAGESMIGDIGAIEEEKIVRAVGDARERAVGIVRVEFDLAFGPKQRRADRAAKIEIEAGGRVVGDALTSPGRGTPPQRITPEDLMRSTIGPAWAGEERAKRRYGRSRRPQDAALPAAEGGPRGRTRVRADKRQAARR